MDNPFDQFDEQTAAPAATAAPPAEEGKNPFDNFSPLYMDEPTRLSDDEFLGEMRKRMADKKTSVSSIMKWSAEQGREISTPKDFGAYTRRVRSGKLDPRAVRFELPEGGEVITSKITGPDNNDVGAYIRGAMGGLSLDWADEAAAAVDATLSAPFSDNTWNERYEDYHEKGQETMRADYKYDPWAAYSGYGTGTVAGAVVPVAKVLQGGNWLVRGLKGSLAGGAAAAASGAGQSGIGHRLEGAEAATPMGMVAGAIAEPVVRVVGRVGSEVAQRTGISDVLDKAATRVNRWASEMGLNDPEVWKRIPAEIKQLATRAKLGPAEVERMREAASTFRRAGVEPRALDTMTRREQDVVAAAGRASQGAGRDRLYQEASDTANQMGSRVVNQFERTTNVRGNSGEMVERIGERRNYNADRAMNAMRNKELPLSEEAVNVLMTGVGRRALNEAIRAADPDTAAAMRKLPELLQQLTPLGPEARRQILRQMPNPFTIGMADRIRIALNDAAQTAQQGGRGGLARDIRGLRDTIRSAAAAGDPQYRKYLEEYAEDATSMRALDVGRAAMDRNTDEFVPQAEALDDSPNAVLNAKDMAPSTGKYEVKADGSNYGVHKLRIDRILDNGDRIHYKLDIPARGTTAEMSVSSTLGGQHRSYGDSSGFNQVGPSELRDAIRYFRENFGDQFPHIEGVTGSRVGGARNQAARQREADAARRWREAEDEAGIQPEYDEPELPPRAEQMEASRQPQPTTVRNGWRGEAVPADGWGNGWRNRFEGDQQIQDDIFSDAMASRDPEGYVDSEFVGRWAIPDDVRAALFDRIRAERPIRGVPENTDGTPAGTVSDEPIAPHLQEGADEAVPAEYQPDEAMRNFESRSADEVLAQRESTARGIYDEYTEHLGHYGPEDSTPTFNEWLLDNFYDSDIARRFNEPEPEGSRLREYLNTFTSAMRDETGTKRLPARVATEPAEPPQRPSPSAGLLDEDTAGEVVSIFEDIYENGTWLGAEDLDFLDRFTDDQITDAATQHGMGSDLENVRRYLNERRSASRLLYDEYGTKRLPNVVDQVNRVRAPAPIRTTEQALTTPPGSGVRATGPSTRRRNERPDWLHTSESYHAVSPREVDAPSDRQLAVGEMRREVERRTGEGVRGAFETGRRLAYSPEQLRRNEALLGRETAAGTQRAIEATMQQAENTARVAPNTGSQTALRGQDDAAFSEMVQFFGNAMTGSKAGALQTVLGFLRNSGMTETQTENLILRTMDPTQTEAVIDDLARLTGSPDKARQLIAILREAQARGIGAATAQNPQE